MIKISRLAIKINKNPPNYRHQPIKSFSLTTSDIQYSLILLSLIMKSNFYSWSCNKRAEIFLNAVKKHNLILIAVRIITTDKVKTVIANRFEHNKTVIH